MSPITAYMSSAYNTDSVATKCIDGITTTDNMCHTRVRHPAPWLALRFPEQVAVARVDIYNRVTQAHRLRNVEVRLTEELPTSSDWMYTGGELLGTYRGPATSAEKIIRVEGAAKIGKYVLIQMNNVWDNRYHLNWHEVEAFGRRL